MSTTATATATASQSPSDAFPLRNIVVPVDGHSASFRALQHALYLNRHLAKGSVTALYVVEPPPPVLMDDALLTSPVHSDTFINLGERVLQHCAESARQANAHANAEAGTDPAALSPLRTVLKQGDITDAILQEAKEEGAQLVVMGTHGRKGFERFLLGSVTEAVLRSTHLPVLALRYDPKVPYQPPHYHRILVPFDGSAPSEHAIRYVVPLARKLGSSLTLLHVVDNRPTLFGQTQATTETDAVAQRALDWASQQAQQLGVQAKIVHLVTAKHPAEAIHEVEADHDLICMGSRGLTGVKRLLLGSVTEAVLRIADRPVLVVHLPPADE